MRKFVAIVLAGVGGLWAGANFVPGFWSYVPAGLQASLPKQARPVLEGYFNFPTSESAKAEAPAKSAGQGSGQGSGQGGGQGGGGRPTPVAIGSVERGSVPFMVESVGTVQAIASVIVRSRVDSQIEEILFADGATVKEGDVLARLDSRAISAQINQAEATLARDRALLDLAHSTLMRGEELATRSFATKQRLDENRASKTAQEAQLKANQAQIELLRTQLSYYTIRAPISGKAGLANLKPGNMARSSDGATALTTINQISPIYIAFSLPQRHFHELRAALERGDGVVEAMPQGGSSSVRGKLALIENTMDNATGTIGVRATFENPKEVLWPGLIADLKVILRDDPDVVTVPREAVQMSQRGNFVFLVVDGAAKMQPVTISRSVGNRTIVTSGLNGGEKVITDGQLLVVDGGKVQPRQATSAAPAAEPGKSL